MQRFNFLTQENVCICTDVISKHKLLEQLSLHMVNFSGLNKDTLYNAFIAREQLQSTGLGNGMALPHIRSSELAAPAAAFFLLKPPIEFNSIDKNAVDLVFALAVPESEPNQYLSIIATIAALFSNPTFRDAIRQCKNSQSVFHLLQQPELSLCAH